MNYLIRHRTRYRYVSPQRSVVQTLCLTPPANESQRVHEWTVQAPGQLQSLLDTWGNQSHLMSLGGGARQVLCEAGGRVEALGEPWQTDLRGPDVRIYLNATPLTTADDAMQDAVHAALRRGLHDEDDVLVLAGLVADRVQYRAGCTDACTTSVQAWQGGVGVCQDHAHVFVALCRSLGVPARYVSGYFHATGAAELASHAWAQVCLDPATRRWLGVDITHRCLVDQRHVQLAVGPDYAACSPVRGVRSGFGTERLHVSVEITPLG